MMGEIFKAAFETLKDYPLIQVAVAITVPLLAVVLAYVVRSKERPASSPPVAPAPSRIEIESPWMIQNLTRMQIDIETIKDGQGLLGNKVDGIAKLLRQRHARKPKG
jgi:hypothetical protein